MSVSSAQSTLRQVENDIKREEKKKSDAESRIARLSKQISDKEAEISKTTSVSSKQSKLNRIKQLTNDLNRAREHSSDAGKKLIGYYDKRRRAEQTLREEQQQENGKETQELKKTISELTAKMQSKARNREPNMIMQCIRPLIEPYPDAISLFDSAAENYEQGSADRNALDDMRLCFEKILQYLFSNNRSLENQTNAIGGILKGSGLSDEYRNLLYRLIDYYCKYQNNHVKHDDKISPYEVDFVIEFTCILIKQLITQFSLVNETVDEDT